MVKISEIQQDRRTLTINMPIDVNDDGEDITMPLVVTYRPSRYTANAELDLNSRRESTWRSETGLAFVHILVVSWDLETDDSEPYPLWEIHPDNLTVDTDTDGKETHRRKTAAEGYDDDLPALAALPSPFISEIISAVSDDMGKSRASSNAS